MVVLRAKTPTESLTDESGERLAKVLSCLSWLSPQLEDDSADSKARIRRIGQKHLRPKNVEELAGTMRAFYEVAASISGLTLHDLTRAVYKFEQKMLTWTTKTRKAARNDGGSNIGLEDEDTVMGRQMTLGLACLMPLELESSR